GGDEPNKKESVVENTIERVVSEVRRISETITSPEASDFRDASIRVCGGVKAAGCLRVGFEEGRFAADALAGLGVAKGWQVEMVTDWGGHPPGAAGGPRAWAGVEFNAGVSLFGLKTGYKATGLMTTQGSYTEEGFSPLRWKPSSIVSAIGNVIAGGRVGIVSKDQIISNP